MTTRAWSVSLIFGLAALLSACSLVPPIPVFDRLNDRLEQVLIPASQSHLGPLPLLVQVDMPRARAFPGKSGARDNRFVGLALSGGGSLSANYSAAVMQELERLGLMEQVNVISSVSGGGLAAGLYATQGFSLDSAEAPAWEAIFSALEFDFRSLWVQSYLAPHNLLTTSLSGITRTDLMARILDERLFYGATFGDLGPVAPRRPVVLFQAVDVTSVAEPFVFSQESFANRISRLDNFPLARAVMASSAFPGVFNSMTLVNHSPSLRNGERSTNPERSHTRLIDGGVLDNLAILPLIKAASSAWMSSSEQAQFSCLMIIVDAHVDGYDPTRAQRLDSRAGFFDFLLDSNVFDALGGLLRQRRLTDLAQVGIYLPELQLYRDPSKVISYLTARGEARRGYRSSRVGQFALPALHPTVRGQPPQCMSWHVALNEIPGVEDGVQRDSLGLYIDRDPVLEARDALMGVVRGIALDFKLRGHPSCAPKQLQSALRAAASINVRDDITSRKKVCHWFIDHGAPDTGSRCNAVAPVNASSWPWAVASDIALAPLDPEQATRRRGPAYQPCVNE